MRLSTIDTATGPLEFGLIVPVLNEQDNIEPLLTQITRALGAINWEIVFVDDGSTDGTLELLQRIALVNSRVRLVQRLGRKGLSTAVVEGMMATVAPIVGVIDGDMQHDEAILPNLYSLIADHRYGYCCWIAIHCWWRHRILGQLSYASKQPGHVVGQPGNRHSFDRSDEWLFRNPAQFGGGATAAPFGYWFQAID
jgi:glycosyltransferase involved in cell wall biosynthesis